MRTIHHPLIASTSSKVTSPPHQSHPISQHVWRIPSNEPFERRSSLVCSQVPPTCACAKQIHRKIPWRLSAPQKRRQRKRLRLVDNVVATIGSALSRRSQTLKSLDRWKAEMPREEEMVPKDKYSIFDRKEKKYRKGIHSKSTSGPD